MLLLRVAMGVQNKYNDRKKLKVSTNREGKTAIICERRGGKVSTYADLLSGNNLRKPGVFPGQQHFEQEPWNAEVHLCWEKKMRCWHIK